MLNALSVISPYPSRTFRVAMMGLPPTRSSRPNTCLHYTILLALVALSLFILSKNRPSQSQDSSSTSSSTTVLDTASYQEDHAPPTTTSPPSNFKLIQDKLFHSKPSTPAPQKEARFVNASELLDRDPSTFSQLSVPKIIHQSWIDHDLPASFQEWSKTCRQAHPDWEYVLWTNADNRALFAKFAPWFLDAYDSLDSEIFRADASRNLYMHIFGGVYADLDTECLRSLDDAFAAYPPLGKSSNSEEYHYEEHPEDRVSNQVLGKPAAKTDGRIVYFGRMGTDDEHGHSIPNAWMASTPGHPFWILPLEVIASRAGSESSAEFVTGPEGLRHSFHHYMDLGPEKVWEHYLASPWGTMDIFKQADTATSTTTTSSDYKSKSTFKSLQKEHHEVAILPFWEIYPYSWARDGNAFRDVCSTFSVEHGSKFNATRCKELIGIDRWGDGGSYSITYWSHTWGYGKDTVHDWSHMESLEAIGTVEGDEATEGDEGEGADRFGKDGGEDEKKDVDEEEEESEPKKA